MKKITIKVYGQVQGVFFRYTTRKLARKLGLSGFVKNMPDGSVYIEAEGSEAKLYDLLEFSKVGPKYADVKQVEFKFGQPENKYKGFDYSF